MNFSKSAWNRNFKKALIGLLGLPAMLYSHLALASDDLRKPFDQELILSLGYSQNGNIGLAYGLFLSQHHQLELGAGASVLGGVANGTYRYFLRPEQKLSPFINAGVVKYEQLDHLGILIGGGLHYVVNGKLSLGCSIGTIPTFDGNNETLLAIEALRLGVRF